MLGRIAYALVAGFVFFGVNVVCGKLWKKDNWFEIACNSGLTAFVVALITYK